MKKWISGLALLLFCAQLFAQDLTQIKDEKPFRWTGTLNMGTDFYTNTGDVPIRSDRFAWRVSGNPTAYLYGFELPFSFTLGQQIRDVRYPTFNQFGVSPTWKWIKLHAGWRNMEFSPYTLAGHTFLGGGVELTPGKFRFAALYGQFHRAAATNAGQEYFLPTYKRMGYGVKIGVGTSSNYLDLMAFKAKDNPNSLDIPDSLGITPGENLVLGLSGKATLWQKFSFGLDGAASAYTRDLRSEVIVLDSFDMADYHGAEKLITPRFSTRFNFAGKATAGYNSQYFGLNLAYERIDPEYATMGAYFFANDVENYTVSPMIAFAKGKARLFGSYGVQRNNLLGNRSETSWRNIGSANLSINPNPKFGLDLNYSNYRMSQSSTAFELSDSLKLSQATTQLGVTPRFSLFGKTAIHTLIFNVVYQFLDDQNPLTEQFGDVRARVGVATWAASFTESKLSVNSGLNYNDVQLGDTKTANYGLSFGLGKPFFKDCLTLNANTTINLARLNGASDGTILNGALSGSYLVHKKHSFNFGIHWIRSTSAFRGKYAEWRGQLGYSWVLK